MRCEDALVALLEHDLIDLCEDPATPLGRHLAGCARCRRVASQLVADSAQLAATVRTPFPEATTRRPRTMPWLVGGALAAASVGGLMLWGGDAPTAISPAPTGVPVVEVPVASSAPEPPMHVAVTPARPPRATAPRRPMQPPPSSIVASVAPTPEPVVEPVRVLPVAPVMPVVATPYRAVAMGLVATDVPLAGTDQPVASTGTILRTSNPNIIVIWHQTP
ncbi:MAG TPA: hypothetical protein VFN22_00135 [Gemmatimonadales bacterium]|nr:hypothetical protein [Gemmatimonadales bacterium]